MRYHIKKQGRTVIKTTDADKADAYRGREGYTVLSIPVSR